MYLPFNIAVIKRDILLVLLLSSDIIITIVK